MARKAEKRRQRAQRLLDTLLEHQEKSGAGRDVLTFLGVTQEWLARNLDAFTEEQRRADGLDKLATIALGELPTAYAEFDPVVELSQLRTIPPSSVATAGMWIGRMFREGITIWSDRDCPQCESGLRVLQEEGNPDHLGYECDVCIWSEDEDGTEWQAGRLIPATTEALRRRGLVPPPA